MTTCHKPAHTSWSDWLQPGLFSQLQPQVINVNQLKGVGCHNTLIWVLCCFTLRMMHWWHLSTCSLVWTAIQGHKKWLHIKSSILSRSTWPTLSWQPFRVISQCSPGSTSWNSASSDPLGNTAWYRMLLQSLRWLHSLRSYLGLAVSADLGGHWPKIKSWSILVTFSGWGQVVGPVASTQ